MVVFTSSTASAEEDACYAAGAEQPYIYKPVNFELFRTVLQGAVDFWLPREADGAVTAGPTAAPPA
ncbi:response regulator [Streptomyces californicus]